MPAKPLHIKGTLKTCHDIGSAKDAMWEAESNLARRMTIPQGIRRCSYSYIHRRKGRNGQAPLINSFSKNWF